MTPPALEYIVTLSPVPDTVETDGTYEIEILEVLSYIL
jgi:hypothetical protein